MNNYGQVGLPKQGTGMARFALLPLLCLQVLAGCGGKPATVSGVVTLDGKPLDRGTVGFTPTSSGMRSAGIIESDGTYVLKTNRDYGLDTGEYVVTVAAREPGKEDPNGGPPMPGPFITPRHYAISSTSGLKFTVEPGSNEINIELTSDAQKPAGNSSARR